MRCKEVNIELSNSRYLNLTPSKGSVLPALFSALDATLCSSYRSLRDSYPMYRKKKDLSLASVTLLVAPSRPPEDVSSLPTRIRYSYVVACSVRGCLVFATDTGTDQISTSYHTGTTSKDLSTEFRSYVRISL